MLRALKQQAKPKQLIWFRGHSRRDWKLVPGLARVPKNLKAENALIKQAQENVARMAKIFTTKDSLLRQVGIVNLYYHLFRLAHDEGWTHAITRKRLADFDKLREGNRRKAELNVGDADCDLLEFDRYAQSPNDGYAIKFRLAILLRTVFKKKISMENL